MGPELRTSVALRRETAESLTLGTLADVRHEWASVDKDVVGPPFLPGGLVRRLRWGGTDGQVSSGVGRRGVRDQDEKERRLVKSGEP